jgi:hypothetical protein
MITNLHDHHDDFGGLQRDLRATGAAMHRRNVLRLAAAAASVSNKVATSQIALPKSACDAVYATSGYDGSARNLSQVSLATDNVFSDGSNSSLRP